jgi:hypothetical protein
MESWVKHLYPGHKSIASTQRYIDVNDELKRSAVEMI